MSKTQKESIRVLCAGSTDFCRRLQSFTHAGNKKTDTPPLLLDACGLNSALSQALSIRPHIFIAEIGFYHNEDDQSSLRNVLSKLRERYSEQIFIVLALTAPERLYYGGDLLFSETLSGSGLVNSFLVNPPVLMPEAAPLKEQFWKLLTLHYDDLTQGKSMPALASPGWVQSLSDPKSRELWHRWLPRYAQYTNESPIVIGETGTGKTNLAYALHLESKRSGSFVTITPRDFSSSELIQAELFGAVAGAYTGAVDKWGLVKNAEKGTLFIDELQSIDKDLQGKLITFIENKQYRRVGSVESIEADVRFVFASNMSLKEMIQRDILREDFAYRLERVQLTVPPLRSRPLDIASGLAYALGKIQRLRKHSNTILGFTASALRILYSFDWPGNLRQLENAAAALSERADIEQRTIIDEATVLDYPGLHWSAAPATVPGQLYANAALKFSREALGSPPESAEEAIKRFEGLLRREALRATAGDTKRAAALLTDNETLLDLYAAALEVEKELT